MKLLIWVVEAQFEEWSNDRWEPTVGVGLTRHAGRAELASWKRKNIGCKFRLRPYWRLHGPR
jgi:hypothetical protein